MYVKKIFYFAVFVGFLSGCGNKYEIANIGSHGADILCFGDSITEGEGASAGNDYPSILATTLGVRISNAGARGDTTVDALNRIDDDVLSKDPLLVVVEFGANDFFRQLPVEDTLKNLDLIVQKILDKGGMVVLVHIRTGIMDGYLDGFKKIAKKRNVYLVTSVMHGIFGHPDFMSDQIHPNDKGYVMIADRLSKVIKPLLALNKKRRV